MKGYILNLFSIGICVQGFILLHIRNDKSTKIVNLNTGISFPYEDFTLCVNFKIFTSFEHGSIFKDKNVNYELFLSATGNYGVFNWLGDSYIFEIPHYGKISLFEWTHFCISFNQTHYWIVTDGKLWSEFTRFSIPKPELLEPSSVSSVSFGFGMGESYEVSNLNICHRLSQKVFKLFVLV